MLKKLSKVIGISILAVITAHFFNGNNQKLNQDQHVEEYARSQATLDNENMELNYGLPSMLDNETMIERIIAKEYEVIYILRMVNYPAAQLDASFLSRAQQTVGRRNCSDADIKWMYDTGRNTKYIIYGADGELAGSFIISGIYCQRFK